MSCATPVVFIIFKRADLTARVWAAIQRVQPRRLFIVADGPRNPSEAPQCAETRRIVEQPGWPCEVQRNYSEQNMGCRNRISSGLDWVFSQTEQAIILEDDCVPAQSFFGFCENLLERYRGDERVMHIGGSNFLIHRSGPYSYHFSRYAHVWGWATWARAWRHMELNMRTWSEFAKGGLQELFTDKDERRHWLQKFAPISTGKRTDTWAYPWQYSVWKHRGFSVVPHFNLVANIGFGDDATHTQDTSSPISNLPVGEIPAVLQHPHQVRFDDEADHTVYLRAFGGARTKLRKSLRYKLSKPVRVYRKLRERWSASRSSATPAG